MWNVSVIQNNEKNNCIYRLLGLLKQRSKKNYSWSIPVGQTNLFSVFRVF